MSGYAWWPMVRITPANGPEVVRDLKSDLSTLWGIGPTKIAVKHAPQIKQRQDVNDRERPLLKGFRVEVDLTFEVSDEMTDHDILAEIVTACLDQYQVVELSMDGGLTYRGVVLTDYLGPDPLGGKPVAGAKYELHFRCRELVTELPAIGTGNW
ncbi:MAG TPA: hypothetical protein PKK95_02600 [Vicinamibacterales bacterium]|nr:hypothetical protein [Vicinamibacterales bacterium]